jgi:class 3 adenylate cyclase
VGDAALNSYIMAVRQALSDNGQRQQVIRTVRGRGYRFVAPVDEQESIPRAELPQGRSLAAEEALVRELTHLPSRSAADTSCAGAPPSDGEYKLVTVLCCALAGASAPGARLGPELLYRRMQGVFGPVQEVLQDYEGTLIHQASEGFTAVFGAPVAQEDHARRAVLAALTLHQRLRGLPTLGDQPPEGLFILCMELYSVWVVVGGLGNDTQQLNTVVGDATELAMRLRLRAAPGTILMSAATYYLVHGEVEVKACGTLALDEGHPQCQYTSCEGSAGSLRAFLDIPHRPGAPSSGGSGSWHCCMSAWPLRLRGGARWSAWSGSPVWARPGC